jgi:uncharacterized protein involved in outer membrane biogenesis
MAFLYHRWSIGCAALGLAIVAVVFVWDWNWLRPVVEQQASSALGRPVTIGHFALEVARYPRLVLDNVAIANPPESPADGRLGTIDRLAVRVDPVALLRGEWHLPELVIEHPHGDLGPGPGGRRNWDFSGGTPRDGSRPVVLPQIGSLVITDGDVRVVEPRLKADVRLAIRTKPVATGGEPRLSIDAKGSYAGQAVTAQFIGGSLLSLRDSAGPYPIDFHIAVGPTRITLKGTLERPMEFAGADLAIELQGEDLSALFPLIGIPLPHTPPYRLKGALDYDAPKIRFTKFSGQVGSTDLSGNIAVDPGRERPLITGDLVSNKVVLADLAGFIGSTPGKPNAPNDTKQRQVERAAQAASQKLIPDLPLDLPKLRAADFKITYRGKRIESESTPLDNLQADLTVQDGVLSLLPLSFGVGQGAITGKITLDGREDPVRAVADIDFRRLDLKRLMETATDFHGSGLVGGQARIKTTGNSLAQMLARGDGELKMFMRGGDVSALLIDLAGLDLGKSVLSMLGLPSRADLRCMVSDFELKQGILETRVLLFDTTEANLIGRGTIDLKTETLDLHLSTEPKHASFGRLPLPIDVSGPLKSPTIRPALRLILDRGPVAAVLGMLTIQLGLGEDSDCGSLLNATSAPIKPPGATVPRRPAAPAARPKPAPSSQ